MKASSFYIFDICLLDHAQVSFATIRGLFIRKHLLQKSPVQFPKYLKQEVCLSFIVAPRTEKSFCSKKKSAIVWQLGYFNFSYLPNHQKYKQVFNVLQFQILERHLVLLMRVHIFSFNVLVASSKNVRNKTF